MLTRTIKVSCLSHFLHEGGCKKCAIPSSHRDTFPAPLTRGTATLTGAVVVRQLAEQPTFIAGPLCVIFCVTHD